REVQHTEGCVPEPAIQAIAAHWGLTLSSIRSVISFYHFLSAEPRGAYAVYLSDSVTDRQLGSEAVLARLCQALGIQEAQLRADGRVSVRRTSCTGLCDQGPAGLINGQPLTRLTPERADAIAALIHAGTPLAQWPPDFFAVHNPVWRRDQTLNTPVRPGDAIRIALALGAEAMIDRLAQSGLRGRGGAGFATARKWAACRQAPGPRAITCNADEGEPGTFKDRYLLMSWAHELIEGMTVAGLTVGATQGYLYVRGEYEFIAPQLREVLVQRAAQGLLGDDVQGSGQRFDIELHLGAGAYVCGEETALIESVEGKRGIPRTRPPFPVDRGVLDQPTVNNNVETFVQVAQIAVQGADWFKAQGTASSSGTRLLSVSGDVAQPGIYEAPWGTRVDEVLAWAGAQDVQAVLVGGPSGHLIPATQT
ncbi:MAG TPA: NAD(P)H-dependent oxidoreductase subunit E, partial [Aquabacterium sp.]|nr:NAD(P)H-dependent oxidoreductase subunit E [Aquabacterium sp.]